MNLLFTASLTETSDYKLERSNFLEILTAVFHHSFFFFCWTYKVISAVRTRGQQKINKEKNTGRRYNLLP